MDANSLQFKTMNKESITVKLFICFQTKFFKLKNLNIISEK